MTEPIISFPMFGENFMLNPPTGIEIFGLKIYFYGIIIATGFILAVAYALWRCRDFGLTQDNILDMLIVTVPIAIIGARLYYVVFDFDLYRSDSLIETLKKIVNIRNGGLAIYGGIIFAVITVIIFCRVKKINLGKMLDIGSFGLLIGQMIGRWGNFINREAFGAVTDVPWKMGLTYPNGQTIYVHPTFFYESAWNFIGFILLHIYSKKHKTYGSQIFAMYAAWYGFGRFWIEWLRVNTDSLLLIDTPGFKLPISVCVAAVSFIAAMGYLVYNKVKGKSDSVVEENS